MTLFPTVLWLFLVETPYLPSFLRAYMSSYLGQGDLSKHSSCANSALTVPLGSGRGGRNCYSSLGYTGGNWGSDEEPQTCPRSSGPKPSLLPLYSVVPWHQNKEHLKVSGQPNSIWAYYIFQIPVL